MYGNHSSILFLYINNSTDIFSISIIFHVVDLIIDIILIAPYKDISNFHTNKNTK